MIRFSCLSCGTKYELKEEFAGRQTRCRTCQQPLTVPTPSAVPVVAPARIDGPTSCLHRLGHAGGVTLPETRAAGAGPDLIASTVEPPGPPVREVLRGGASSGPRYVVAGELGRGGMGMVLRAIDCDLRREVAVKYLLAPNDAGKQARFVEEAQVTGQLEHPNIPPVHELGVDAQKRLFFTMKMVRGRSLAQVLDQLRKNPRTAEKEYTLGRLLTVLVNVCHALSYAHARGVVHRDLKPGNVMLGDFGEVYVMDWGLAKVLQADAPLSSVATARPSPATDATQPAAAPAPGGDSSSLTGRVVTSRTEEQADLTREGAVLGTLDYMPPEQAMGRIQEIDQRSDVYALGALLYEMLTLLPPVDREAGYAAVLHQVIRGKIVPPQERTPQRAREGRIPSELSAIALKALARKPSQRYPTAEAFRRDIELYQEGRSVSAKEDSRWEQLVKFVKRNRGFSAATSASLVVIALILGFAFAANSRARVRAEEAYNEVRREQEARRQQGRHSAPSFLRDARASVGRDELDYALAQVNVALEYDPGLTPALLLKGQLLVGLKQFEQAGKVLTQYLERKPDDEEVRKLAELSRKASPNDFEVLRQIHEVFLRQQEYGLASKILRRKEELLGEYRKRLEAAWGAEWPEVGKQLTIDRDGNYSLNLEPGANVVKDLSPLKGLLLTSLDLSGCPVSDLSPLKGMLITSLILRDCPVTDLSPLHGMPLTRLTLVKVPVQTLSPLQGMKLVRLNLGGCSTITDFTPLVGMPLTWLNLAGCIHVRDLTPLQGMKLTRLDLRGCQQLTDFAPLRDMPLTDLNLGFCPHLPDLKLLQGMKLTVLDLNNCGAVKDLTPLKGMPLTSLDVTGSPQLTDLTPLQGMKLTSLYLQNCPAVKDLTSLEGMPLQSLWLPPSVTRGMDGVRKMTTLKQINRKPAAEFWKEYDAKQPDR